MKFSRHPWLSEKSDIPPNYPYRNYTIYMDMKKFIHSGQNQIHEPIALGLGSNVSPRFEHLNEAVKALDGFLTQLRVSTVYETDPIGMTDQPLFLNACCVGWTDLGPADLLGHLKCLERAAGREVSGERFGPRELDIDILLYGEEVVQDQRLTIPHPRMIDRAFVLVPLAEVASEWVHSSSGTTIAELSDNIDRSGVRATNLRLDQISKEKDA